MNQIKKIVLTGGPCAGKTTAMVKVIEHFSVSAIRFYHSRGSNHVHPGGHELSHLQQGFFFEGRRLLSRLRSTWKTVSCMAETLQQPVIIVCDRGTMDISTHLTPDFWHRIISEAGYMDAQLRDRYDAVLHLVSAADGAEQFYTTANNAQRLEKADEEGLKIARELDKKIVSAWKGHPHLRVINNHEDFNNKLNRVLKEINNVLAIPQPIEEERKYIVKLTGEVSNAIDSDIVQTYLTGEPGVRFVFAVAVSREASMCMFTPPRSVFQTMSRLRPSDRLTPIFTSMLQQADPYRQRIHKHRKSFIWKASISSSTSFLSRFPT